MVRVGGGKGVGGKLGGGGGLAGKGALDAGEVGFTDTADLVVDCDTDILRISTEPRTRDLYLVSGEHPRVGGLGDHWEDDECIVLVLW